MNGTGRATRSHRRTRLSATHGFAEKVALLVIGFALTGVVGTWVSTYWQGQEAERLSKQAARQAAFQTRTAIIEEMTNEIASTFSAVEDVLEIFEYRLSRPKDAREEFRDRLAFFKQDGRRWRVASKVLRAKMGPHFANPRAPTVFEQIIVVRHIAGVDLRNLLDHWAAKGGALPPDDALKQEARAILPKVKKVTDSTGLLPRLIRLLTSEALAASERS